MDNSLPKVLAISLSTWRKDSGIHTQTDLFKFWDKERLAQIYTKSDLPYTPVCDKFFQISENAVIKSVFTRKPVGREVFNDENNSAADASALQAEQKLYAKAHKKKSWFMTLVREIVWAMGCWKSKALDDFVKDFDPDVYFIYIYPGSYMAKLQRYIMKKHPRPYVCYITDDNYSYKGCGKNIFAYIHRFFLRKQVKALATGCNEIFTITQIQGDETDAEFGTKSIVLTKGINYDSLTYEPKPLSSPIRMVYTGNLFIGRHHSLVEMSKAMEKINKDGEKIVLDIYSTNTPDDKTLEYLNKNGCRFHGRVPKEEVEALQKASDIVIFVESLEKQHRYAARLSFSTKLTDYFKSGKCIFAIGDSKIAPIMYLEQNDAAVIATNYEDIEKVLRRLTDNPELVTQYGKKAFDCGKRNHNEEDIKRIFTETICKAARNGK